MGDISSFNNIIIEMRLQL